MSSVVIKREIDSNGYFYVVYVNDSYVTDYYDESKAVKEAEYLGNGDYCKDYSL